ncbi:MAG: hypothetical protein HY877_09205 [Deltaproteobacteria bacterium]|nr:hypothetical protein [Deltaproteobacteria bacterium]
MSHEVASQGQPSWPRSKFKEFVEPSRPPDIMKNKKTLLLVCSLVLFLSSSVFAGTKVKNVMRQRVEVHLTGGRVLSILPAEIVTVANDDFESPQLRALIEKGDLVVMQDESTKKPSLDIKFGKTGKVHK